MQIVFICFKITSELWIMCRTLMFFQIKFWVSSLQYEYFRLNLPGHWLLSATFIQPDFIFLKQNYSMNLSEVTQPCTSMCSYWEILQTATLLPAQSDQKLNLFQSPGYPSVLLRLGLNIFFLSSSWKKY